MSKEADFMVGMAMGALFKVRQHAILKNDPEILQLIEDDYQELKMLVENFYYPSKIQRNDA